MSTKTKNNEVRLADYKAPAFLVDETVLDFDIQPTFVRVKAQLAMRPNPAGKGALVLLGEAQKLISVQLDGETLSKNDYVLTEHDLTIKNPPKTNFVLEIESTHEPKKNTTLSGLYGSGSMLSTQCEPEGFRRITYHPDRPDVMSKFTVTIHADKKAYPVLLSNGNLIGQGKEKNGRHWVKWQDPFKKPSYLFALVAGKLDKVQDTFVTKSKRKVLIEIYVEPGKKNETGFALAAIKKAMKWDEERFGLEYDLDRFMIVAVSFFNMGAMENKGLNIFNDACVLGRAETATDSDIAFIERVVGHEYFHNWTGDRITCRDWFQLSLKEGLTVFREQEFCGAMTSPALERLTSVSALRRAQFPEDAGAMAHPIRPASYQAIDNFYTATVYNKGSEVCRMIQTLVSQKGFRKGMDLYVKRHDGQAATCEDFVSSMSDANKIDLDQFMTWYRQAGTPVLKIRGGYHDKKKTFTLTVKQSCPATPGQPKKEPFHMPLSIGLISAKGKDLIGTKVLSLKKKEEKFVFKNIAQKPVPSLLRSFSAPVRLDYPYTEDELLLLMTADTDGFNRWEAGQALFMRFLLAKSKKTPNTLIEALRAVLLDKKLDAATKAMTLALPSEAEIGLAMKAKGDLIDPLAVYEKRQALIRDIATGLGHDLAHVFEEIDGTLDELASDGVARGKRSLKNLCLAYLAKVMPEDAEPYAVGLAAASRNLTDQSAGLSVLTDLGGKSCKDMLALFENRYKAQPNIMDEWMSVQASVRKVGILHQVKKLTKHKTFSFTNPNRVSALLGVFAMNPFGFHATDGSGYKYLADTILKIDPMNPHTAARLAKVFLRWKDFDKKRQKQMKAQLVRMSKAKKLSANVREIVGKSLKN